MWSASVYLFVDYLGGLAQQPDPVLRGSLSTDSAGLHITTRRHTVTIEAADIASIEAVTEHAARVRTNIGRLFGVLGTTAKGAHDRAALLVHTRQGETACVRVPGWSEYGLLDHLAPWLEETGIALAPGPDGHGPTASFSVADELRKLAELRDQGLLSEEEFALQRAKLLS